MKGFTLVELLVVIAIAGIIFAGGIASISIIRSENNLLVSADLIKSTIEKSRASSVSKEDGYGYSIKVTSDGLIWFLGKNYNESNSLNKKIQFSSDVKISSVNLGGGDLILFDNLTGTTTPGTIVISSKNNPLKKRTIVISGSGKVYNTSSTVSTGIDNKSIKLVMDWSIQGSSEIKFIFLTNPQQTIEFLMHPHFNGDESVFNFVRNISVQGSSQEIRINSSYIDDKVTNLSINRVSNVELKPLEIYIDNKLIVTYLSDNSVLAGPFGGIIIGK